MITPEYKKIERYVWELSEKIQGNVTSSKPATAHEAIRMAHSIMDQAVRFKAARSGEANKRKWENPHSGGNNNNNNRNNTHHHQQNHRQKVAKAYVAAPYHPKCRKCQRTGHLEKDCRVKTPTTSSNTQQTVRCFGCREKGHYRNKCPKRKDKPTEDTRRRSYVMRTEEP
uniref:CCHC-type domain-containing protein n=1 Tax=Tanacetum cinerariifolium TaxID=118510 RepID=A0A699IBI7_TANCI|nr:hypothetical protein [Tanacetum cinerariifolium]